MNGNGVKAKLHMLAEYRRALDALMQSKQNLMDELLSPDLRQRIDEVEMEFSAKQAEVTQNIAALESTIKENVMAIGKTVSDDELQAVYRKGSVTWNTNALEGFMAAHPEIKRFRTVGKPSVAIREVRKEAA